MSTDRSKRFYLQTYVNIHLILAVLLLQYLSPNTRGIQARPVKKVVGGSPAPRGRFPYMCSLRRRGDREHKCGGTLIEPQWVITAAHCVDPHSRDSVGMSPVVYCGIYDRDERSSNKTFTSDRTYLHPQWSGNLTDGYDIALIKLDRLSDSPLPNLDTLGNLYMPGNVFSALGWGFDSSGSFTDLLQIADRLPFVSTRVCNLERYWAGQIRESMICAGTGEQDTQPGDSGGPLLQLDLPDGDYTLGEATLDLVVGITSFGEDSSRLFKPGVYTSVSYFRDWIDCIIEEKENCSSGSQVLIENVDDEEEMSPTTDITSLIEQDLQSALSSEVAVASIESFMEQLAEYPDSSAAASSEAANTTERNTTVLIDRVAQLSTLSTPSGCRYTRGTTYPNGIVLDRRRNTTNAVCCEACRESSVCFSWYHNDRTSTCTLNRNIPVIVLANIFTFSGGTMLD